MRRLLTLATALLGAGPVAHAELIEIRWAGNGRFVHQASLAPGKFVELCGKLPAGLGVRWDFEADAPLEFNVHYHTSKDVVVYPAKLSAVSNAKNTLTTKIEQDYCWMWSNTSAAPASLRVTLQR